MASIKEVLTKTIHRIYYGFGFGLGMGLAFNAVPRKTEKVVKTIVVDKKNHKDDLEYFRNKELKNNLT